MLINYNTFIELFLKGTNLRNVVCHLCNQHVGASSDPITETLTVIATTPLSVVITEAGVAMFKDKPTMVLPYTNMNAEQLLYIKNLVDGLVKTSTDGNLTFKGHVQMGGGCIVMLPSETNHEEFVIKHGELLHAFIDAVNQSNNYNAWTKKALCSIIMQRVSCTVNLPKDTMHNAIVHSESLFSSIRG